MTEPARVIARTCAAAGLLGLVLAAGPAWALDLPAPGSAPAPVPAPLPTGLPAPVQSLLPAPVASALDPVTSRLPGAQQSAEPSPRPAPKPKPTAAPGQQVALADTGVAALSATLALQGGSGTAALRAMPGIIAPVAAAPTVIVPDLAPALAPVAAPQALPPASAPDGLPALVVALALTTVSAAAAGQVAAMAERRRTGG